MLLDSPKTALETIAGTLNYADLPEDWQVPNINRFSSAKTLYDYQTDALQNAARALFLYYGDEHDWTLGESQEYSNQRKLAFAGMHPHSCKLSKFNIKAGSANRIQDDPVFRILSDYFSVISDSISYHNLINRMCFWMATGSGKTLVMVKLIEYLHFLIQSGEIPPNNILILAPSNHLLNQISRTIDEFNQSGDLQINFLPLRQAGRVSYQQSIGKSVTAYYHRSDNISDERKKALTDYREYENGGKWYVLLDEAHKGGIENSKRQAYYAVMAREGFLFNFSATFTDDQDIITTVKKYNLEDFIKDGYGKNIYLNEGEYSSFINRRSEISDDDRQRVVLKSIVTLAYVSMQVKEIRENSGLENAYHSPLMLTLVNSVSTDAEKNDLLAFFQVLHRIATGDIESQTFKAVKNELLAEWRDTPMLFGGDGSSIVGAGEEDFKKMKITDLREAVFLSRRKGALQVIRSKDNKEIAFQLKNADKPFALIRIGNISKWSNDFLLGYEETTTLKEKSFFDGLEKSQITILMGSRTFFESWDSNRPNVINFINIGGRDAKKFVVQSVGRGVRIEPLKNERRRLSFLLRILPRKEKIRFDNVRDLVPAAETFFIFATNRNAIQSVLSGLQSEKGETFEKIEGLLESPRPKVNGKQMSLLVPVYEEKKADDRTVEREEFAINKQAMGRFKKWLEGTSDSVLAVRDNLSMREIRKLRGFGTDQHTTREDDKNYKSLSFLQSSLASYFSQAAKVPKGVREIDNDDIVHFREIRVYSEDVSNLNGKINRVKHGRVSVEEIDALNRKLQAGEITQDEFARRVAGTAEETFRDISIKKILGHYYFPVLIAKQRADYIKHIIKVRSEVDFLNELEEWTQENEVLWDAWMFSKIDETLDKIHIPYFDSSNQYRDFFPDFVFWMCKDNKYRIVFVDPKGTEHTSAYKKIDGYKKLFEENGRPRIFQCGRRKLQVQVELLMFNNPASVAGEYRKYWTDKPEQIFADSR